MGEIPASSPLYKWALGKFRKAILSNAELLESYVSENLDKFIVIPEGYKRARQITLRGSKNTRPDDLIYKPTPDIDPITGLIYHKVIIHDTKLHKDVPWTTNQNSEIISKFEEGIDYINLELRTEIPELPLGTTIRIFRAGVFKSIGTLDKSGSYLTTYSVF